MRITSSLRFLYISWGSGLLCGMLHITGIPGPYLLGSSPACKAFTYLTYSNFFTKLSCDSFIIHTSLSLSLVYICMYLPMTHTANFCFSLAKNFVALLMYLIFNFKYFLEFITNFTVNS